MVLPRDSRALLAGGNQLLPVTMTLARSGSSMTVSVPTGMLWFMGLFPWSGRVSDSGV